MTPLARFEAKVLKTEGCWLWQGGLFPKGYGSFWLDGKNRTAHRVAYELYVGKVPSDLIVCHRCDVRSCVNPHHLFLGTDQDNADDRERKGRTYRTWSHEALDAARVLRAHGMSWQRLAIATGIPHSTLERLVR